jgi:hypothetical protein
VANTLEWMHRVNVATRWWANMRKSK